MWDILRCVTAHDTRITNCISQFDVKKDFPQQLQRFYIYRKVYRPLQKKKKKTKKKFFLRWS